MRGKNIYKSLIIGLILLLVGFVLGFILSSLPSVRRNFSPGNDKLSVIIETIAEEYVDSLDIDEITELAIPHFVDELDPHSAYIPADELAATKENLEGEFAGVGISFCVLKDTIVIMSALRGSPAQKAGLQAGDRIIEVDGENCTGLNLTDEEVRDKLRGEIDTKVCLTVRPAMRDTTLRLNLVRSNIPVTTIKAALSVAEGVGYIKIFDSFTPNTYSEFIGAMARLLNQGCSQFIIDLRGNGGGVMESAVNICNEFLPAGDPIVYAEGQAFEREYITANGLGTLQDKPVVILVDQFTASASEIIAGAVQDNDRGLIIGRRTFGKGLIQNQIEFTDGSALLLTVARYYTPSGRNIQRPYEMGNSNDYNNQWIERFSNGEEFSADSVRQDKTLLFHTRNGREVYGGGGIMPDIFVPLDTAETTSYYINLENSDIFRIFAAYYSDSNRTRLNTFRTSDEMLAFLKSQPILYEVTHFAEQKGIKRRTTLINTSSALILRTVYAHILMNFFDEEAFFSVFLESDSMIKTALENLK